MTTTTSESTPSKSLSRLQELFKANIPLNWVFAGDSITHGAFHTFGFRDYTEHFSERVRYEMSRRLDMVIKTGVSGWKITDIQTHINRVILDLKPNVISINIGMNDAKLGPSPENVAAFDANYRAVLDKCLATLDNPVLILQTPQPITEDGTPRRQTLPLLCPVIRTLAADYGAILVDHDAIWRKNTFTYWLNDAIHPNYHGHRKMAEAIFKAVDFYDPQKSLVCKLDIPHMG